MFRVKETTMPFHYNETVISEDSITTYTALDATLRRYAEKYPGESYILAFLEHTSDFDQSCIFETALRDGPHHLFTDDHDTIWILGPYGLCCVPLVDKRYIFQLWKPHYFTSDVMYGAINNIRELCFDDDSDYAGLSFAYEVCEGVIVEFNHQHRDEHRVGNNTFISFSAARTITRTKTELKPKGREILFMLKQEACRIHLEEPGVVFVVRAMGCSLETVDRTLELL